MSDLYAILGVPRDASEDDIKRAYRRKAREAHPDRGGDEEAFKEITRAYQVLSDPQRRARYDRFGDDGTARSRAGASGDPFGFGAGGFGDLGDVINAFFGGGFPGGGGGGGRRRSRARAGRDVVVPITVTLEEIVTGTEEQVEIEVADTCDACGGSGSTGGGRSRCSHCGGSGSVQRVVRTAFGRLATATACERCEGTGVAIEDPCTACGGEGRRVQRRTVTVPVPPGIEDGDRLRVSGQGEAGRAGGTTGDLYVQVSVEPHDVFRRDDRDLIAEVRVPLVQAALGTVLRVPTIDGDEAEVRLPAGTQPGDELRVRRAGIPLRGGGPRGDLILRVRVEVPRDLDAQQRELLEELARLRGEDVSDSGRGLFTRLREAFR